MPGRALPQAFCQREREKERESMSKGGATGGGSPPLTERCEVTNHMILSLQ